MRDSVKLAAILLTAFVLVVGSTGDIGAKKKDKKSNTVTLKRHEKKKKKEKKDALL